MLRNLRRQARDGEALPFAVTYDGELVGQLNIGNIVRGSLNSGYAGYWIDERVAGRGVMPTALALAIDHCFGAARLHRIEANIRPENVASRRVVEKLGFREEGMRLRYLHIDGAYRDHICYAITKEEAPDGVLRRWRLARAREP
jgi:ribosomal-protein-alanine N-acetyltransferase